MNEKINLMIKVETCMKTKHTTSQEERLLVDDPIQAYLRQIGRVPRLNEEEEAALSRRILHEHDDQAMEELVEANLRLVTKIAKFYQGNGLQYLDLIQEGNIALMRAAQTFDYTKGRFSSHAGRYITQALTRATDKYKKLIVLSIHMSEDLRKFKRAKLSLEQSLMREPSDEEVASYLGMPLKRVRDLNLYSIELFSLDCIVGDDATLYMFVENKQAESPESVLNRNLCNEYLYSALEVLTDREAEALKLRYGLNDAQEEYTYSAIGEMLDTSRQNVKCIETRALNKLRAYFKNHQYNDVFDILDYAY